MRYLLAFLVLFPALIAAAQTDRAYSEQCVLHYARHYGDPAEFIAALIDIESGWNPHAVSSKGAMGLMQLMPTTARRFGAFQPFDIAQNIAAGTRYVTTLMWEFHGDLRLVSAAYYAGDHWIGEKQLNYRNPDVITYVRAVRTHYIARRLAASAARR